MLVAMHPDVSRIMWRYRRWHHYVDYSKFMKNNILKLKPGVEIPTGINNYGLKYKRYSSYEELEKSHEDK